ncbi:PD-(D/E)XK motif protein [Streptacidiphilus sp. 4-A2]|nr:PD-(D/E)XK motif protein [Streptacidiphilus sp. 4-A2]
MSITEDDWADLEIPQAARGRSTRRLHPESTNDLYIAVTHPGLRRMLVLTGDATAAEGVARSLSRLAQTAGLELRLNAVSRHEYELQVLLTADELREVFSPLVADIAAASCDAPTTSAALVAAVERYERWQHLLRSVGKDGLGAETRRGLFGELLVLCDCLLPSLTDVEAVNAWTGPTGTNQDFQLPSVAIEAKTSTAKTMNRIRIASERQLDRTGTPALLLAVVSLDERRGGSGESLNALVDRTREHLTSVAARVRLDGLLIHAGYLPGHRDHYAEPRYTLRDLRFWNVRDGFPRLVESDLPSGVDECSYQLNTASLDDYLLTADEVTNLIRGAHG